MTGAQVADAPLLTVAGALCAGRARIVRGWTWGDGARNGQGDPCPIDAPEAVTWCVFGGLMAGTTARDARALVMPAESILLRAGCELFGSHDSGYVSAVNDDYCDCREDAVKWYDLALRIADKLRHLAPGEVTIDAIACAVDRLAVRA